MQRIVPKSISKEGGGSIPAAEKLNFTTKVYSTKGNRGRKELVLNEGDWVMQSYPARALDISLQED